MLRRSRLPIVLAASAVPRPITANALAAIHKFDFRISPSATAGTPRRASRHRERNSHRCRRPSMAKCMSVTTN